MELDIKKYEPIFGEWTVAECLGKGSYGSVYKIVREDFGITYASALKVISIPQDENDIRNLKDDGLEEEDIRKYYYGFVEEIVKEISVMSRLKGNTNIVSYEDHKVIPHENGLGWDILIRMELLTPLTEYYRKHNMTEYEVVKMGIDICRALALCHKAGIVHRDIKPENIFISSVGDYKLGDFGIAKKADKTTGMLSQKGTLGYMAPEVYREDAYNISVDIYSLSLVLYRLLNYNRFPFLPDYPKSISYADREQAFQKRIKGEEFRLPVNASQKIALIIRKGCEFQPQKRYASADSMQKELENAWIDTDKKKLLLPRGRAGDMSDDAFMSETDMSAGLEGNLRKNKIIAVATAVVLLIAVFLVVWKIKGGSSSAGDDITVSGQETEYLSTQKENTERERAERTTEKTIEKTTEVIQTEAEVSEEAVVNEISAEERETAESTDNSIPPKPVEEQTSGTQPVRENDVPQQTPVINETNEQPTPEQVLPPQPDLQQPEVNEKEELFNNSIDEEQLFE